MALLGALDSRVLTAKKVNQLARTAACRESKADSTSGRVCRRDVQRFAKDPYKLSLRDNNSTFAELAATLDARAPISERPDGDRASQNVSVVRGEVVSGNLSAAGADFLDFAALDGSQSVPFPARL